MREINIAMVIATKRKEKGITQDTLAAYIGVSKTSVSKWETAQSYPDITLLPRLASYFNISIDELIGYLPQMTKEDIKKTYRRLAEEFTHKPFPEVLSKCREIIKIYFSCFPLLLRMAILLLNHYTLEKEQERQEALLQEIMDLCIRMKRESDDVWIAKQANSIESICRIFLNQPLEALALMDETMKPQISDNYLLSKAYQMIGNEEKAKSVLQISFYQHLQGLLETAQVYLLLITDQPEKFEQSLECCILLSETYEFDKLDPNLMCKLYLTTAQGYSLQGNLENALIMLEKYSYICTTFLLPYQLKGDAFFDHIDDWLKEYDFEAPRNEKTIKASILQSVVENPAFSPLHGESKYINIVHKLKSF